MGVVLSEDVGYMGERWWPETNERRVGDAVLTTVNGNAVLLTPKSRTSCIEPTNTTMVCSGHTNV